MNLCIRSEERTLLPKPEGQELTSMTDPPGLTDGSSAASTPSGPSAASPTPRRGRYPTRQAAMHGRPLRSTRATVEDCEETNSGTSPEANAATVASSGTTDCGTFSESNAGTAPAGPGATDAGANSGTADLGGNFVVSGAQYLQADPRIMMLMKMFVPRHYSFPRLLTVYKGDGHGDPDHRRGAQTSLHNSRTTCYLWRAICPSGKATGDRSRASNTFAQVGDCLSYLSFQY